MKGRKPPTVPPGFSDAIKAIAALNGFDDEKRPPASQQIARLRELAPRYMNVLARLKVGDLVTFDENVPGHLRGEPCQIVDLIPDAAPLFVADPDHSPCLDPDFGARYDARIMHIDSGGLAHCHWVESWQLVPFAGPERGDGLVGPSTALGLDWRSVYIGSGSVVTLEIHNASEREVCYRAVVAKLGEEAGTGSDIVVPAGSDVRDWVLVSEGHDLRLRASQADALTVTFPSV